MDDALSERMEALSEHITFAREWKALKIVQEELINLHGLIESIQAERNEEKHERNAK